MKTKNLVLTIAVSIFMTSCVTSFYQVYKAVPTEKVVLKDNALVYEDENCKVTYDFWGSGGNMSFQFYNKTDKNIYLNMEESFFVVNGISYNYFKNREFSYATSVGASAMKSVAASKSMTGVNYIDLLQTNSISATNAYGLITSKGYSVTFNEEKILCIPSRTSKIITEYIINQTLIRDCELFKYPAKKQIKTKNYSKNNSPLVFSNRLSYSVGQKENFIEFENEFYVSEITNLPESEMIEEKQEEFCGQKAGLPLKFYKSESPSKFFIQYLKGSDTWKH